MGPLPSSKVAVFSGILSSVMAKSSGPEAADVVSFVVGDGDVELDEDDADTDAGGVILGRGSASAAGEGSCK